MSRRAREDPETLTLPYNQPRLWGVAIATADTETVLPQNPEERYPELRLIMLCVVDTEGGMPASDGFRLSIGKSRQKGSIN